MISPSANHEAFIGRGKDNPPVGIIKENQDTPYAFTHGERFDPRNDFLEDTEIPDDPLEPTSVTETVDDPTDPTLDLDLEQTG